MSSGRDGEAGGEVGGRADSAPGMLHQGRAQSVLLCVAGRRGEQPFKVVLGELHFQE